MKVAGETHEGRRRSKAFRLRTVIKTILWRDHIRHRRSKFN
ncbi:hypothetical protein EAL2_c20450 [Peptoclostridium acidaminophilum DSM 3953]|uniref:Uncharacterized protein n=1 Tax=Peptoclostridium acidaminophilum DSM 3953 TaxID=1286171 RepID=W8U8Z4_PEPAC|nr:hypothetical protein EAL2_c20450 [Peptoclostridium acidaminophilum DSM 3953]